MSDATGDLGLLALLPSGWLSPDSLRSAAPIASGMSAAAVFRIAASAQACYLKIANRHGAEGLREEIARTCWLGTQDVPVPRLLRTLDSGDVVAMLTVELPGSAIAACRRPVGTIVDIIARGFATLHAVPTAACPFDESVETRLARARKLIARLDIEPAHFAERNRQFTPQQIYDRLAGRVPPWAEPVVVHGDATFDNMRIDAAGTLNLLDCGHAGRGDRYVDLERIANEIADHFGAQWIEAFRQAYGIIAWDGDRASFFADLYELF